MRIALLSDIHGNPIAFDAVLDDIRAQGGVDGYWILGDLAAIGPDPIGVLQRLVALPNSVVIRGNTDRYLVTGERPWPTVDMCEAEPALWKAYAEVASSFSWTQGAVTAAGWVSWLSGLPLEGRIVLPDGSRVLGVHASPGRDDSDGIRPGVDHPALCSYAAASDADLVFVGHTHWSMDLVVNGVRLVNAGSVSNPFPPDLRASYVVLEADESAYRILHRRVTYEREAVVAALQRVNHPASDFIVRFMHGKHLPPWNRSGQG